MPIASQLVLVALEGPPERGLVLGVLELRLDLLAPVSGRRASSSSAVRLRRRSSFCPDTRATLPSTAARRPARRRRAVARKNSGSSSGPRPIVVTWRPSVVEERRDVGPSTTRTSWRACSKAPASGAATSTERAGEVEGGAGVVAHALVARSRRRRRTCAAPRSASPPSAAAASRIAGHLEGGGAERRRGADDARAHRDDGDVGVGDVAGQGEGGRHRHRLEVATEGVAGGDGDVDEPGRGHRRRPGRRWRSAGRRRRSSRRRAARRVRRRGSPPPRRAPGCAGCPTTTGMPPRSVSVAGSCSSVEPASTWRLV